MLSWQTAIYNYYIHTRNNGQSHKYYFVQIGDSDFANLIPITFRNEADIRLFTINDVTTLEYNDYVILTFYPASPAVIPALEGVGEYIRTSAIVNIIDNDRKC